MGRAGTGSGGCHALGFEPNARQMSVGSPPLILLFPGALRAPGNER
jgi:hypothetical protein